MQLKLIVRGDYNKLEISWQMRAKNVERFHQKNNNPQTVSNGMKHEIKFKKINFLIMTDTGRVGPIYRLADIYGRYRYIDNG